MFTHLHRSHLSLEQNMLKRVEKPAMEEIRMATAGNIGPMSARPVVQAAPAEGCEDTEVPGF